MPSHPPQPQLASTKQKGLLRKIHLGEQLGVSKRRLGVGWGGSGEGKSEGVLWLPGQTPGLCQSRVFLPVRAQGWREVCAHTTKNAAVASSTPGARATERDSRTAMGMGEAGKAEPQPCWGPRWGKGAPHTLITPHQPKCL